MMGKLMLTEVKKIALVVVKMIYQSKKCHLISSSYILGSHRYL